MRLQFKNKFTMKLYFKNIVLYENNNNNNNNNTKNLDDHKCLK